MVVSHSTVPEPDVRTGDQVPGVVTGAGAAVPGGVVAGGGGAVGGGADDVGGTVVGGAVVVVAARRCLVDVGRGVVEAVVVAAWRLVVVEARWPPEEHAVTSARQPTARAMLCFVARVGVMRRRSSSPVRSRGG
jgi:hypothetical protein